MILLLQPGAGADGPEVKRLCQIAGELGLGTWVHEMAGATRKLVEVHLLGATATVPVQTFAELPFVERVIRVSQRYRLLGRHDGQSGENWQVGFQYRGLTFDQEQCHVFAGLCAVDNRESVGQTFAALERVKLRTARMGAYKPRTSPYDFQGHGAKCLPYVFELAGKHGVQVIAMEVTHESHVEEIRAALAAAGDPCGVMVQIGTRNAQNFELLKAVGQQKQFPVLFKRGMGITLEESLNACEYVASEGNRQIIFGLRGVKSHLGDPHRNLVDFAHVPVVKRLTRMPVGVDPSHSVGRRERGPDGIDSIFHATAQGVIAGANLVLVDFHPDPARALCDGPQALTLDELEPFLADVAIVRQAYARRREAAAPGQPPI
jgi:3-deoxy-7-phosphoheptulonate synthase